jgi:hypothetical protein
MNMSTISTLSNILGSAFSTVYKDIDSGRGKIVSIFSGIIRMPLALTLSVLFSPFLVLTRLIKSILDIYNYGSAIDFIRSIILLTGIVISIGLFYIIGTGWGSSFVSLLGKEYFGWVIAWLGAWVFTLFVQTSISFLSLYVFIKMSKDDVIKQSLSSAGIELDREKNTPRKKMYLALIAIYTIQWIVVINSMFFTDIQTDLPWYIYIAAPIVSIIH